MFERKGIVRLYAGDHCVAIAPNDWMYSYAEIAGKCIGLGDPSYRISAFYLEYENVSAPGSATVTPPTVTRADGIEYYNGLSGHVSRDFLRVRASVDLAMFPSAGYEEFYGADKGNTLRFRANTTGGPGIHGKTFSHTVYSKVFGVAVVATPSWEDRTQDIVYARAYFPTDKQWLKTSNSQVSATYDLIFP
jgi:hypothetical protein